MSEVITRSSGRSQSVATAARRLMQEAEAVSVPPVSNAVPSETDMREVRAHCANLLRRAVLTMAASPDRERRFLKGYKSGMPEPSMSPADRQAAFGLDAVLEAAREAQEIQARRASRFKPTALDIDRCLPVLEWMAWLGCRNDGQKEAKIITAWAHGVPLWRLAQRFGCSDDTVRRWLNGAVAAIAMKFRDEVVRMM